MDTPMPTTMRTDTLTRTMQCLPMLRTRRPHTLHSIRPVLLALQELIAQQRSSKAGPPQQWETQVTRPLYRAMSCSR